MKPALHRRGRILVVAATVALAGCGGPRPSAFIGGAPPAPLRVAVLPLANYSADRDATDRIAAQLLVEMARVPGVEVVEPGRVEEALSREPWLLADRIPPDLVDSLGVQLGADALLVGSVLAHDYREEDGRRIPQVSLSLRLMATPGGRIWWSAHLSRDGGDAESVFGIGRVSTLDKLTAGVLTDLVGTLPALAGPSNRRGEAAADRE